MFRLASGLAIIFALATGCTPKSDKPTTPTNDAFVGRLVADGKPVNFPADETVQLQVFTEKGSQSKIPIRPDGSFKIGWFELGKYTANLIRAGGKQGSSPVHAVPGGFEVVAGKTEYTIELGKNYKP